MIAQAACESLLLKYENVVGERYFKVQFKTEMVPLIYIKYVGAKADSKPSELMAAKNKVQFMIYGFNQDGSLKGSTVTSSSPGTEESNITGTLDHVIGEISKRLDKYL